MTLTKELAATRIQKYIRGYLTRKKNTVKSTKIGKGITSTLIKTNKLSFDLDHYHEILITRINLNNVDLQLVSNQGNIDTLQKYLTQSGVQYGAMINGGFYTLNSFYDLRGSAPIGLHRFPCNYSGRNGHNNVIKKDFDNTSCFSKYSDEEKTESPENYKDKPIGSQLHLKTQTPLCAKDDYGLIRIMKDGSLDCRQLLDYQINDDFPGDIASSQYLFSSGPILVWDGAITFSEDKLNEPQYQFKQVYDHFGSHPGSVPPGTFYHADQRNPRSGIAINQAGELLMITVKGDEDPIKRDGMKLPQFASLMKRWGAVRALNLDGGYSACQIAGSFDPERMFTPTYIKQAGRGTVLPYAIVALGKEGSKMQPLDQGSSSSRPRPTFQSRRKLF